MEAYKYPGFESPLLVPTKNSPCGHSMHFLSLLSLILIVRQDPGFQNAVSLLSRSHALVVCCLTKLHEPECRARHVLMPQKLLQSVLSVTQHKQQVLVSL